jgi:tRNA(fMet)-specific endonuclease VapC
VTYLLDTNACVMYLNGRASRLRRRLDQRRPDEIVVCSIVKAELS